MFGIFKILGFPFAELKRIWKETRSVRAVLTEPVIESDWERLYDKIKGWRLKRQRLKRQQSKKYNPAITSLLGLTSLIMGITAAAIVIVSFVRQGRGMVTVLGLSETDFGIFVFGILLGSVAFLLGIVWAKRKAANHIENRRI